MTIDATEAIRKRIKFLRNAVSIARIARRDNRKKPPASAAEISIHV
jgi:hypothetical protein